MHSAAAFLSMPNSDGVVRGGNSDRGFNDQTTRGYPLRLTLTTRQVTDVVMYDEEILSVKRGRMVKDDHKPPVDEETRREETRKTCALRYLEGYPDTKVIDPIKDNYPACTAAVSDYSIACDSRDLMQPEVCARVCGACSFDTRAA